MSWTAESEKKHIINYISMTCNSNLLYVLWLSLPNYPSILISNDAPESKLYHQVLPGPLQSVYLHLLTTVPHTAVTIILSKQKSDHVISFPMLGKILYRSLLCPHPSSNLTLPWTLPALLYLPTPGQGPYFSPSTLKDSSHHKVFEPASLPSSPG